MPPLPLALYGEVTTSSGARFKWDANQPAGSRPLNLSFRTKIGEGFSDSGLQFARRIDGDYPDLELVNSVVFTGADGTVAYEGRIAAMPRDLSDRHSIGVTLAGWMSHAKDRKFAMPFVDRRVGEWAQMPFAEQTRLATSAIDFATLGWTNANGALVCALPNQALGAQVIGEAWYEAPAGCTVAAVGYRGSVTGFGAPYELPGFRFESGTTLTTGNTTTTMDGALHYITPATPARRAVTIAYSNGSALTPNAGSNVRYDKLAVYGNHGLTRRTGDTSEPDGVYASDVIKWIAQNYCPQINTSGVQDTSYVIQHLAFDRTFPYDAWLEVNKYHLWHLGVWEGKRLDFRPYDLTDYDWEIRTDDPGTTFSPQGPTTENLFNGIEVTYTDPLTGAVDTITPDTSTALADTSTSNPWNKAGIDHRDDITLSAPTTAATAALLGQAALADRNRPRTPGTITVRGYIRDRAGNDQPCWKVRAGDTISITNFPNDTPRLIVETDYDDETKTVRLAIDQPFALLDAYLDRQNNALQAAGLA